MARKRPVIAVVLALAASLAPAATDLVPQRVAEVSRQVEEVRGRRFERPVPAVEVDPAEARRILRGKILEALPASADEYLRSLVAVGLIEDAPGTLDRLIDFYGSQVVAFYDPEPRRFYVVKGAEGLVAGGAEMEGLAQGLIYSHELMHALQDESLRLDARTKALKDDGDRGFALQCLLEGEATFVMIKVALKDIPGADERAEEELAPLLTAGGLERANVPKNVPDYFVEQLFFPYVAGSAFVREAFAKGGWAEVDRLWRHPPESSAEIMHGEPYPAPATGLLAANFASLFSGGRFVYADTLGEWTMKFLLGRALPEEEAAKASEGWRGDRIAFGVTGGRMGYVWRVRFDEAASAGRFEAALRKARGIKPVPSPETIRREGRDVVVLVEPGRLPPA
jgi:hypothetical protein